MSERPTALVLLAQIEMSRDGLKRRELLHQACDLFENEHSDLSERETELFDDIFNILSSKVETASRSEVSERLSKMDVGLNHTMFTFASDPDLTVAAPALTHSTSLSDSDLVAISQEQTDYHRLAIAKRSTLSTTVTDELITRGSQPVLQTVTENKGAQISPNGFSTLADRSKKDEDLQHSLSKRGDIDPKALEKLLEHACDDVRAALFAKAGKMGNNDLERIIQKAQRKVEEELGLHKIDFIAADRRVRLLSRKRPVDEGMLRAFAKENMFGEMVIAVSLMFEVSNDHAKIILTQTEPLLIASRSKDFTTETVHLLLSSGPVFEKLTDKARAIHVDAYSQIRPETAQRVVRFWQTKKKLTKAA